MKGKKVFLRQEVHTQAGNKVGQEIKTNTLDKVHTSSLPLKQVNFKPADKKEYLTTANVMKENTDKEIRLDTINQIMEDFQMTSSVIAVESTPTNVVDKHSRCLSNSAEDSDSMQ